MDELGVPTPRNRSRSKTPVHVKKNAKATVATLAEETVNVRTSARTTRQAVVAATTTFETSQKVTATTVITSSSTNSNAAAAATIAGKTSSATLASAAGSSTSANGSNTGVEHTTFSTEMNQHELNNMFEENSRLRMRTSTPIQTQSSSAAAATGRIGRTMERKSLANSVLTADGNDHVPYREYRDAGEYWNKYPKTDYTYSRLSPHRREIVPGVIAMPNMSRRSLDHHHERVDVMAQKAAPGFASFIRTRYQAANYKATEQQRRRNAYAYDSQDSQDEVDEVRSTSYRRSWRFSELRIVRWLTTIVTVWSTFFYTTVTGGRRDSASNVYHTRVQQETGWWSRLAAVVTGSFLSLFRYVYLAISTVLFLDTWLLRSHSASSPTKKRVLLLLLLVLLPLLLTAAWQMHDAAERDDLLMHWPRLAMTGLPLVTSLSAIRPSFDLFKMPFEFPNIPNLIPNWDLGSQTGSSSSSSSASRPTDALSEQQYHDLLAHLNHYVESYVNDRLVNSQSPTSTAQSALSEQHVAAIAGMITERIVQQSTTATTASAATIDEIVAQLMHSDQLTDRIDSNVRARTGTDAGASQRQIDEQQQLIQALQLEIARINDQLAQHSAAQQHTDAVARQLHDQHDQLTVRFHDFQAANEQRLSALLLSVNVRLDDLGRTQFASIDDRVKLVLMDVLGYQEASADAADLQHWIRSVFVAKSVLEERLAELAANRDRFVLGEIDRSADVLMQTITERIRAETLVQLEQHRAEVLLASAEIVRTDAAVAATVAAGTGASSDVGLLTEAAVRRIVSDALTVYDADKTGMVDYALESSGGEIVSTRCTESYHTQSAQISVFGIPLWYPTNTPRTAISPTVQPGQCWAFRGFPGFLVLKLNAFVYVTGFTIEHIPRAVSPYGRIDSAPKTFTVWGLEHENDHEPLQFGTYEFQEDGSNLQYFRVDAANRQRVHNIVELRIESNHGNANYTCLYRFRVHGTPAGDRSSSNSSS